MKKYLFFAATALTFHVTQAQVANYRFMHEFGPTMDVDDYPGTVIINHDVQDDVITPRKVKLTFLSVLAVS